MTVPTFELKALPPALPSFVSAALTARRRPPREIQLPPGQVRVAALRVDSARLRAYNALLGFEQGETLPLTYPHVLGSALHMHLMSRPGFPLPMLGLVHVRNEIVQARAIGVGEVLDLQVRLSESRAVAQGLEFDLVTEFAVGGVPEVWRGVSTYLHRRPGKPTTRRAPTANERVPLSQYLELDAPADIGRRYAKVSRDYNPIHLYALTAKLFGFPRAIATGMWTAARVLALLEQKTGCRPSQYRFQFKQPLFLPGRAALRFDGAGDGLEFALVGADAAKVHLLGTLAG